MAAGLRPSPPSLACTHDERPRLTPPPAGSVQVLAAMRGPPQGPDVPPPGLGHFAQGSQGSQGFGCPIPGVVRAAGDGVGEGDGVDGDYEASIVAGVRESLARLGFAEDAAKQQAAAARQAEKEARAAAKAAKAAKAEKAEKAAAKAAREAAKGGVQIPPRPQSHMESVEGASVGSGGLYLRTEALLS